MRKPVFAIWEQQRRRSACASAQSDQRLVVRYLDSIIPLVSISEISSLQLASVAAEAGLNLTVENPKDRFSCDEAQAPNVAAFLLSTSPPLHGKSIKSKLKSPARNQLSPGLQYRSQKVDTSLHNQGQPWLSIVWASDKNVKNLVKKVQMYVKQWLGDQLSM